MSIRLYVDSSFTVGSSIEIPLKELHYLKAVRRSRGHVALFNRQGQIGEGSLEGRLFKVERISTYPVPLYDLTVACAWPEPSQVPDLIRAVSEVGARKLIFFRADRSQRAPVLTPRLMNIAIESARQCGRTPPLQLDIGDWRHEKAEALWFCDELEGESFGSMLNDRASGLLVIGPEGGWADRERLDAQKLGFRRIHFKTPILRVGTAVIGASLIAVQCLKIAYGNEL